jgi:hypothetical protein
MLRERFDPSTLLEADEWHPFPRSDDHPFWEGLPTRFRDLAVEKAEASLQAEWPALPASLALLFERTGRRDFEGPLAYRRMHLQHFALGRLITHDDRFLDPLADAVWSICEESAWNQPAHLHEQAAGSGLPDVTDPLLDLGAGDSAAMLAWVSYLLRDDLDSVSPLLRERVALECRRRITDVLLHRRPHYWQTAVNNWNPWIISNVLAVTLCTDDDQGHRIAVFAKAIETLDHFIDHYPPDGGCDEGPTYWTRAGGNLILCLDLLHSATGGALDVYADPLIAEIGRYVHRMFIGDTWFVNFADGAGKFLLPSTAWRYGRAIGDPALTALGFEHLRRAYQSDPPPMFIEHFPTLLPMLPHLAELYESAPLEIPLVRDAVLPEIEVLVARDQADTTDGWFLAAKGGHNDEVHNHNDVGSLVVFLDGEPLLVDAGVGPYTRATFSHERYTIWTMQSGWHSVPVVNGIEQRNGRDFAAQAWSTSVAEDRTSATVDIAGAYPAEAGIASWVRTTALVRGAGIDLTDRWTLAADGGTVDVRLLTCHEPAVDGATVHVGPATLTVEADVPFEILVTRRDIDEPNIAAIWGPTLHRIEIVCRDVSHTGEVRLTLRRT